MSKLSNNQGRGYEYACLYELYKAKRAGKKFNDLVSKDSKVYKPIIAAYIEEIKTAA